MRRLALNVDTITRNAWLQDLIYDTPLSSGTYKTRGLNSKDFDDQSAPFSASITVRPSTCNAFLPSPGAFDSLLPSLPLLLSLRFCQIGYKFPATLCVDLLESLRIIQVPAEKLDSSSSTDG